jgi:hypothetical protein
MARIIRTAIAASGGPKDHVARYMLAGSLVLISAGTIMAFALA